MNKTKQTDKIPSFDSSVDYISVGLDVGADFTWMSIALPNKSFVGKPFKIVHSDAKSREAAIERIKEAQKLYSLKSRCFLESTGIYHIPLLYFLHDNGFVCETINPIITKNSTNWNVRKVHNDKLDSKKVALIGLGNSLKTSLIPDDNICNLRNLVRDYYYFKDEQAAISLKLIAELKVSFPEYAGVFSKVTGKASLALLKKYPLASDILKAPKDEVIKLIRSIVRFGDAYVEGKYEKLVSAARDAAIFGHAIQSNAVRIKAYIASYEEHQKHLDSFMDAIKESVEALNGTAVYEQISLLQTIRGIGFLSAVVLVAEMGDFSRFPSPRKLFAFFGMDPSVKDSGKFHGDQVHMSKRGSRLARRILHMAAINNLKVSRKTGDPVNPVIHSYYAAKCSGKKKKVAVGAVMHKICNYVFAVLRNKKPYALITAEQHRKEYEMTRKKTA